VYLNIIYTYERNTYVQQSILYTVYVCVMFDILLYVYRYTLYTRKGVSHVLHLNILIIYVCIVIQQRILSGRI